MCSSHWCREKLSLGKLWGTLRLHPSGAKTPYSQMPVVCLITFSQTLGSPSELQWHHACGLMSFLSPALWNCHRLFVRKQLPCDNRWLQIWGTCILIVFLHNYKRPMQLQWHATCNFIAFTSHAPDFPRSLMLLLRLSASLKNLKGPGILLLILEFEATMLS